MPKYSKSKAKMVQEDLTDRRKAKRLEDISEMLKTKRSALGSDDPSKMRLDPDTDIKKDVMRVKSGDSVLRNAKQTVKGANPKIDTKEVVKRFPNSTDKISTKDPVKVGKGSRKASSSSLEKLAKKLGKSGATVRKTPEVERILKKIAQNKAVKGIGKGTLKSFPLIGGIATAISSGDAAAGVIDEVVPGGVESLGGGDQAEFERLMHELKKKRDKNDQQ